MAKTKTTVGADATVTVDRARAIMGRIRYEQAKATIAAAKAEGLNVRVYYDTFTGGRSLKVIAFIFPGDPAYKRLAKQARAMRRRLATVAHEVRDANYGVRYIFHF